jgi:hypothetical protein
MESGGAPDFWKYVSDPTDASTDDEDGYVTAHTCSDEGSFDSCGDQDNSTSWKLGRGRPNWADMSSDEEVIDGGERANSTFTWVGRDKKRLNWADLSSDESSLDSNEKQDADVASEIQALLIRMRSRMQMSRQRYKLFPLECRRKGASPMGQGSASRATSFTGRGVNRAKRAFSATCVPSAREINRRSR